MADFCTVKRAVSAFHIDGADGDADPDRHQVTGMVTFTPVLLDGDAVTVVEDGEPKTLVPLPIQARISDGVVFHRGVDGVRLLAGGEGMNPERLSWRARFEHMQSAGVPFKLRDVVFEAVPGGTVDLSTVAPVPGTPGVGVTRGRDGDTIESITADATHLIVTVRDGLGVVTERRLSLNDAARAVAGDVLAQVEAQAVLAGDRASAAEAARAGAVVAQNTAAGHASAASEQATRAQGFADRAEAAGVSAEGKLAEVSGLVGQVQADVDEVANAAEVAAAREVEKLKAGAPEAFDTLGEIAEELQANTSERAALAQTIAGKADRQHTHVWADLSDAPVVSESTENSTLVKRTGKGRIKANPGANSDDVATVGQMQKNIDDFSLLVNEALPLKLAEHSPKVQVVSKLPSSPDPQTVYLVTGA